MSLSDCIHKGDDRSGAVFSACEKYRFALWRNWDWQSHANCVMFIGLNPSTATETANDKTISNCIGFAKRWGYGGLYMMNLYAFRETDPQKMYRTPTPVGDDNDEAFGYYRTRAGLVVAAWGGSVPTKWRTRIGLQSRIARVLQTVAQPVHCLGRTQDGSPRHPSRLGYSTKIEPFWSPTP